MIEHIGNSKYDLECDCFACSKKAWPTTERVVARDKVEIPKAAYGWGWRFQKDGPVLYSFAPGHVWSIYEPGEEKEVSTDD